MLKSYIYGIGSWIVSKIYYSFKTEKVVNELHDWIEKQPHLIQSTNVSYSIFVKVNGTLLKKRKHLIQISVRDMHNDLTLPVSHGGFHCDRNEYGKVCIGDTSLRMYRPKHIKLMRNSNNITYGRKICISAMSFQSNHNKWRLTQFEKLDKLYISTKSTRLLQRPTKYDIEYNIQTFPNNSHNHIRNCNYASSYHCPSTIAGSKIPIWDCMLNCCAECPGMKAPDLESSKILTVYFLVPFIK